MKSENQLKNLSILLIALTLMTLVASGYYHLGFNRTLDPLKSDDFSLRVNTDQDHGGLTRGTLTKLDSGALLLNCDISLSYKHPFCEISFDYHPVESEGTHLDLSVYNEVAFDVRYSGDSLPRARFIIRNFDNQYSKEGDLQSDKFNIFEFDTSVHGVTSPLSLDYLYVPKWWFDYYNHPVTHTAVDISDSVSIEIGTEELVSEGTSTFEIHSIEFRGKWLPLAEYQRIIIAVWILTLFGYLIFYLIATQKMLRVEKAKINQLQSHLTTLQKEVSLDPLTGLRNRRGLDELFEAVGMLAKHNQHVSIAVLDIDHFKKINDTYGHSVGDDVLRQFSQTLINSTGDKDILIRWGGEEFVVINVGRTLPENESFFNSILTNLKLVAWPRGINLTASVGITALGDEPIEVAIERADKQLYIAKATGRDKVVAH
ncbi:GGDEF domain-containing protein [Vibrio sp. RE86]|uniref:GGDEF domain-containing protein n=1 Tax=Vibrio sp. RE86 TaxID=2607605 RepID=UPI001493A489|nr:GGDEF domain-containing protein [Vibrio sp. RE86]